MTTATATPPRSQKREPEKHGVDFCRTNANHAKLAVVERVLKDQLAAVLTRGFHGIATLELAVQDGTIQHVRHGVERTER
jgi:hypothetical protein